MIVSCQALHSQSHVEFGVAIHFEIIYSVHSGWSGCIAEGWSLNMANMTLCILVSNVIGFVTFHLQLYVPLKV